MKYFSELTKKTYDTEEECVKAEVEHTALEARKKEEANAISKEKKAMAEAVEQMDTELDSALERYKSVREEARKIIEEATEKANKMVAEARADCDKAQRNRYEAIANFNKKFGVYTAQYDGDRALRELRRSIAWVDGIFNRFF